MVPQKPLFPLECFAILAIACIDRHLLLPSLLPEVAKVTGGTARCANT